MSRIGPGNRRAVGLSRLDTSNRGPGRPGRPSIGADIAAVLLADRDPVRPRRIVVPVEPRATCGARAAQRRARRAAADQPAATSRTTNRHWLLAPTQVWSVMLGLDWAANAQPESTGDTTFQNDTL